MSMWFRSRFHYALVSWPRCASSLILRKISSAHVFCEVDAFVEELVFDHDSLLGLHESMALEGQPQDLPSLSVRIGSFFTRYLSWFAFGIFRVAIDLDAIQRFTMDNPKVETERPLQAVSDEPIPKSRREIIYNRISEHWGLQRTSVMSDIESGPSLFDDIQAIETFGDYGSKVQTLVRHLCYLKHADPGAKSIIFSAWADSLHSTREHPI